MCGIVGIISLNRMPVQYESIIGMADEIPHRGPDGEGFLVTNAAQFCSALKAKRGGAVVVSIDHSRHVAFGHRRLSILDLNLSAAQPMKEATSRYWIVYNGEIYNQAELRKELIQLGYKFETDHSDTEVILNAYACWGKECLLKLNGMWAFCIWDTVENSIFLSRDEIGKKPLYYTEQNGVLYFASELKALVANNAIPKVLNEQAVSDYLTFNTTPAPATIFKHIKKLPAAHYLFFKDGQDLEIKRYWSPLRDKLYLTESEDQIVETLRNKLCGSVKKRLMADVEVGALLSGGLDSSINLACLNRCNHKQVKAFCVGFENKNGYTNEFAHAERVARLFKADYYQLQLTEKDFFEFLPQMVYYQDEPVADAANIPIYYVSKLARQNGVKVLLGGEGSDELFVGYQHWVIAQQFERLMKGKRTLSKAAGFLHKNSPLKNKRKYYHTWYEKINKKQPVFWGGTEQWSESEKRAMFSADFSNRIGNYSSFARVSGMYEAFRQHKKLDGFDWMSSVDLAYRLPDLLLARLDRMTMAASVEGRNPFLDVDLVEYIMRIPSHLKNKNGQEKYILKKAFEGILPHDIIYRKKDSFSVPLDMLFSNKQNRANCMEVVKNFNRRANIFSADYLKHLEKSTDGDEIWTIVNLAYWYERFN